VKRIIFATVLLLAVHGLAWAQDSPPAQPQNFEDGDYFLEVEVSDPTPYVGEQIIYILRYYAFYLPDAVPYQLPAFDGFWLSRTFDGQETIQPIGNRQFFVGEVVAEITPLEAGELVIEPASFEVEETVFRTGVRIESERVRVTARPLPPGAPESFNGAVGQFDVDTEVDRTQITLGEPVMLELTIDGLGNLELVPPPELPDAPGWRVFTEAPTYNASTVGGIQFGQKTFRWSLIPTRTGTQTFPPITFAFFDPRQESYRGIASLPITIEVFPGESGEQTLADVEGASENVRLPLALKPIDSLVLPDGADGRVNRFIWALWGIAPLVTVVVVLWQYERKQSTRRRDTARRKQALTTALARLQTDPEGAIETYLRHKLSGLARQPNGNVEAVLTEHGINGRLLHALIEVQSEAQAIRYLPHHVQPNIDTLRRKVAAVLKAVDKQWRSFSEPDSS
jgi:hypothetical protein